MFLCSHTGQWLKPVGIMGSTFLDSPLLHLMCDDVCGLKIKFFSLIHDFMEFLVNFFWKTFLHDRVIEYVLAKNVCNVKIITHFLQHPFFSQSNPLIVRLFTKHKSFY